MTQQHCARKTSRRTAARRCGRPTRNAKPFGLRVMRVELRLSDEPATALPRAPSTAALRSVLPRQLRVYREAMESLSFRPGRAFSSVNSPAVPWTVVFEDEGVAGYFYACDRSQTTQEESILDAMLIYNVG